METSVVLLSVILINMFVLFGDCNVYGRKNVRNLHEQFPKLHHSSSARGSAANIENLRSSTILSKASNSIMGKNSISYAGFAPKFSRNPSDRTDLDLDFLHAYTAPNLSPVKHTNTGGLFSVLLNGSEDDIDAAVAQNAALDTIADILSVIGLKDLRDWLGIIAGLVILGPLFVIILLIPAPILILGALIIPLIWYNPPTKINNGVVGHDGPTDAVVVDEAGRAINVDTPMFKAVNNSGNSNCVEMLVCEVRGVVRRITSSGPVSRAPAYDGECAEYYCSILHPLQTFLFSYYFYIFGDGKQTTQ